MHARAGQGLWLTLWDAPSVWHHPYPMLWYLCLWSTGQHQGDMLLLLKGLSQLRQVSYLTHSALQGLQEPFRNRGRAHRTVQWVRSLQFSLMTWIWSKITWEGGRVGGEERKRTYTSCPLTTTCAVRHEQPSTRHILNKHINDYKNVELFLFPPLTTTVSQWTDNSMQTPFKYLIYFG